MDISPVLPAKRFRDLSFVVLAYVLAFLAAIGVARFFQDVHPLYTILAADIAGTLVVYLFGRVFRNASFYDPYWSVAPPVIVLFLVFGLSSGGALALRQVLAVTLVFLWGIRLTFNWVRGWQGVRDEDWRYQNFRNTTGGWFWLVDLFGIELLPTMFVFLGCLSLYPALSAGTNSFNVLDVIAIVITAGAILLETTADEQLKRFTENNTQPGAIMAEGLWAYSRHPNYLGEVAFWWGLFFFGLAANAGYWWTIIGPVSITLLFTTISIPMIEKRHLARRLDYAGHQKRVSPFLPWFPRGKKYG
jgi:steroid 5-alpha reductase family enzyme